MRSCGVPLRLQTLAAVAFALLCSACASRRPSAKIPGSVPSPNESALAQGTPGATEVGYASWYGDPYSGRRAADGEVYNKKEMTAAHRILPFQTMVKVTNLENQRAVTVRITDRGPFVQGRIIDLSLAAASKLAMIGPGTALVRLEVLGGKQPEGPAAPTMPTVPVIPAEPAAPTLADVAATPPAAPPNPPTFPASPDGTTPSADAAGSFAVQVGAFQQRSVAERLRKQLASRYGGAFIESYQSPFGLFYRVRVGPRPSMEEAQRLALQLQNEKLITFVVRLDQ